MSFEVQNQIRQNANDIRSYISDLHAWEDEINNKTTKKTKEQPQKEYAIRGNVNQESKSSSSTPNVPKEKLKRDTNTVVDYYRAWDKFDVDSELSKVEGDEPQAKKEFDPKDLAKRTSGAKENTKIVIKGGRSISNQIDSLKEKGNLYFKSCEFDKAIEAYTDCLKRGLELEIPEENLVSLYTNRSIAYIKQGEYAKAEDDCNRALIFEPMNIKALIRRGRAKHKLQKYKEALIDFQEALKVEPDNGEIKQEVLIIQKKLSTIKDTAKAKMVQKICNSSKTKHHIKVIDSLESHQISQPEPIPRITEQPGQEDAEVKSEFVTLKGIEGKVVTHHKEAESERAEQKVHFTIDLDDKDNPQNKPHLDHIPKKSSLKKKTKFHAETIPTISQPPKLSDAIELGKKAIVAEVLQSDNSRITESREFLRAWKHVRDNEALAEELFEKKANPEEFLNIFREGLEIDLFLELVKFAESQISKNNIPMAMKILKSVSQTKRFDILVKSLTKKEKELMTNIFNSSIGKIVNNDQQAEIDVLKKKFCVMI